MVDEWDMVLCTGVETDILALREGSSGEAGLERLVKRAKGAAVAGAGKGKQGGLPSLSGPFDTSRDAIEALVIRFQSDRHRVSDLCLHLWANGCPVIDLGRVFLAGPGGVREASVGFSPSGG